jgi:filamentous hemagglutinin
MTLTTDEALSAGQKYLGPEYREIGKPGSGVFHSADGTREFRIDSGSKQRIGDGFICLARAVVRK